MAAKQKPKPRPVAESPAAPATDGAPGHIVTIPRSASLKILVFVSGAVLMGLEIVGSRILAPYFGNSVFVWGSLISLFLIALSAGYYGGGLASDRMPSRRLLNVIVLAVAAWMFLIPLMADAVCAGLLRVGLGEKSGPFVAAAVLFLLPSIGMGMVSPFAIRLATHAVSSVGKTAGTLYALSTLGSIAGTMLTTFVLIPALGASAILQGLAGALLLTALATFPFRNFAGAALAVVSLLALASTATFASTLTHHTLEPGEKLVRDLNTPYHHISVVDASARRARMLKFDRYIESSVSLDPPYESLSHYTRYFHLALVAKPDAKRVLFIGAGGGVGPRAFHMHNPQMQIDVVDIDQKVLDVAREDFFLENSPNIRTIAADGRLFVRNSDDGYYDAIVLDAFTIGGRIPFHLATAEYFTLCREKLAPGGVFMMNINSAVRGDKADIFNSMYKTLDTAFPAVDAFALFSQNGIRDQSTNIMLVAVNRDQSMTADQWSDAAAAYTSTSYVDSSQIDIMLRDRLSTPPEAEDAAVFTDDYAPIETMSF